ncbi:hypothetical protein [Butyrivibrio fibrisolvens]|uniref:hypothetical protein n=1 Tax=Butyrivibrio fibrisolvens TaxID=831 RepID=UPI0003B70B92|nr:hypothetical protein [Butyrivibrio fibrisolvens]
MKLYDENQEFAFLGTDFTNIGEDNNSLFDTTRLKILFTGISKSRDSNGENGIVLKLNVYNRRATDTWLCYSYLYNNDDDFTDDFIHLEPNEEQELSIYLEDYDIAYTNNHYVRIHFILEDGRRRILGRCNSLCVEYNNFSGRYQYKIIDKFSRSQCRELRELDIKVNKMDERRFFSSDWSYMYFHNTIPIIVSNHTDRQRAFIINLLEFDGDVLEEII